jgi:hypothetical protein
MIDFGFGAGQRLKFVVFPLNALMFKLNFEQGDSDAKAVDAEADAVDAEAQAETEKGFKDIL